MARPKTETRQRLLDGTVEYVAANGIADISLRQLAEALGTSHRMLISHFGSKEELLVEVVRAVEDRQRALVEDLMAEGIRNPIEQMVELWRRLTDPAMAPQERLFFELYGQALQGRAHTAHLLDGIVRDWLGPIERLAEQSGSDPAVATIDARLAIAVTRGLLLDLLATGDRDEVDACMARFADLFRASVRVRGRDRGGDGVPGRGDPLGGDVLGESVEHAADEDP